ncbi:hypothetical protein [Methanobacterium formicicum]|uniref:Uncharacterized protein n=1 Tax=Methanobacterium formicicum (strain DSM 3637 / PP1) TaxID=1204725 RepID=K2RB13_METFP|nr:hypothetical protein [Methanobacterium formicicum]EKF85514.1 hypothetical protein A994_08771 [Methanobacterium formicicum DSM 3637]
MENKNSLPQQFEVEYSFAEGGHNSLKLVDGRLFFFSEADSHLSEKNEYLTMVSIPEEIKWEQFWDELNQCGIWDWDECQWRGEAAEDSCEEDHEEEHCQCADVNCDCDSVINENIIHEEDLSKENKGSVKEDILPENIQIEGDIWQLKIIMDTHRISCKSWCLKEKSTDEFFQAIGKLAGVDITEPFSDLSKRLTDN